MTYVVCKRTSSDQVAEVSAARHVWKDWVRELRSTGVMRLRHSRPRIQIPESGLAVLMVEMGI
jgi:hypothetical protein